MITKKQNPKNLFLIALEERKKESKLKRAYYSLKAYETILLMNKAQENIDNLFNVIITAYYYGKVQGKKEEKSNNKRKERNKILC